MGNSLSIDYKKLEDEIKEDIKELKRQKNRTQDLKEWQYLRGKIDGLVMVGQTLRYYYYMLSATN